MPRKKLEGNLCLCTLPFTEEIVCKIERLLQTVSWVENINRFPNGDMITLFIKGKKEVIKKLIEKNGKDIKSGKAFVKLLETFDTK